MNNFNFIQPQKKSKTAKYVVVSLISLGSIYFFATAGSLTPSLSPASTFHTLTDIWDSIASGSYDSSGIAADANGSLIAGIKYLNNNLAWASGSNNIWTINSGNVGIGTTSPAAQLDVLKTTNDSGNLSITGLNNQQTITGTSGANSWVNGTISTAIIDPANTKGYWAVTGETGYGLHYGSGDVSQLTGVNGFVETFNSATAGEVIAVYGIAYNYSTGTVTSLYGGAFLSNLASLGNVTNNYGVWAQSGGQSTGTITNDYGIYVATPANSGGVTISNHYGLYLNSQSIGTRNYAIYSAGTGDKSYFAGRIGIGSATSPDYSLEIASASSQFTIRSTGTTASTSINLYPAGGASSSNQNGFTIRAGGIAGAGGEKLQILNGVGTRIFQIASSGHISIGAGTYLNDDGGGTSQQPSIVNIQETLTTLNASYHNGINNYITLNPAGVPASQFAGIDNETIIQSGNTRNFSSKIFVTYSGGYHNGSGTLSNLFGVSGDIWNTSSGTLSSTKAGVFQIHNTGLGTITSGYGLYVDAATNSGGGTFLNNYGVYIVDQHLTGSNNNFNLYSVGSSSRNFFAGRVGIGTASSSPYMLTVASKTFDGNIMSLKDSDGTCLHNPEAGGETVTCASDQRLKTDITDAQDVLPDLMKLRIRDYTVISSGDKLTGVIAQEVQQIFPDMVIDGPDGYLMVSEISTWKLIKAIQELNLKLSTTSFQTTGNFESGHSISGLISSLIDYLKSAVLTVKELVADKIESRQGITTYDKSTGEAYCIGVAAGVVTADKGKCGQDNSAPEVSVTPVPTEEVSPSESPVSEEIIEETTPSPESTPESSPSEETTEIIETSNEPAE